VRGLFGKDEVPSSNLGSSSKKSPFSLENGDFCYFLREMMWVKMWVNRLTHTVTHTAKYAETDKEGRTGNSAFLSGILLL